MLDHGREQSALTLEVSVDQPFGAPSRRGNFASGCDFITLGGKQSQGRVKKRLFLSGPIACPLGPASTPVFAQGELGLAHCLSLAHSCRLDHRKLQIQRYASDGSIAQQFECDNFVYSL